MSFAEFDDILTEVGLMLSDVDRQGDVVKVTNAAEIEAARQQGKIGFLPTLEHLAIGSDINRLDILYSAGVRLAGLNPTTARTTSATGSRNATPAASASSAWQWYSA